MTWKSTRALALLLFLPGFALAESAGRPYYISDDIPVTLREQPRNDATVVTQLKSGVRVTLLQSLGRESFARIRTADGREGWMTARYLSTQPSARDRYQQTQQELAAAQDRIATLERELNGAQQQLARARPAFEAARENERLRTAVAELERSSVAQRARYDAEKARRRSLLSGGALVLIGALLGLVLPWLGRGRKRRYSDF